MEFTTNAKNDVIENVNIKNINLSAKNSKIKNMKRMREKVHTSAGT